MSSSASRTYIIPAKITVPRLPGRTVSRPRVDAAIRKASESPLIILQAPAGFGKTLAALQSAHHLADEGEQQLLSWLSLDASDDDPDTFWRYLSGSLLAAADAGFSNEAGLLDGATDLSDNPTNPGESLLAWFGQLDSPLLVVLDDFHHIRSGAVHDLLAYVVKYLPDHVRLLITTREEPPTALAVSGIRGLAATLNVTTLAFDAEETAELLTILSGEPWDPAESEVARSFTGGWPVGLHLMGLQKNVGGAEWREKVVPHANPAINGPLADYLETEFLATLPGEVRIFLDRLAPLQRFNESLALRLCPDLNVYEALYFLTRNQLFLEHIGQDEGNPWLRFHPLVRDFLIQRLRLTDLSAFRRLQVEASRALVADGELLEALELALAAEQPDLLQYLMGQYGNALIHRAHYDLVARCLRTLPESAYREDPELFLVRAWVEVIYGAPERVRGWLQQLRSGPDLHSGWEAPGIRRELLSLESQAAYSCGRTEDARTFAEQALADGPGKTQRNQGAYLVMANLAFDDGRMEEACAVYEQAEVVSREAGNYDAVLWSLNQQARIALATGDTERARLLARDAVDYADHVRVKPGFNRIFSHILEIEICLEHYQLREARDLTERVMMQCERWETHWRKHMYSWLLKGEMLRGRPTTASDMAQEHEPLLHDIAGSDVLRPYSVETHLLWWWLNGDRHRLQTWLKTQRIPEGSLNPGRALLVRGHLYALVGTGEYARAVQLVRRGLRQARQQGLRLEVARLGLVQVALSALDGEVAEAERLAESLLPEAARLGLIASWLYYHQALVPVLRQLLSSGRLPQDLSAYVEQLLRLHRQRHTVNRTGMDQVPDALQSRGVSRKEWRVYRLILQGYRNDEIAASSFVALSTVKTHINNLYRKLDVRTRRNALLMAKDLGIEPGDAMELSARSD